MKKYVKPDLAYENFMLNQSVASCGMKSTTHGAYDCTMTYGDGVTLFVTGNTAGCDLNVDTDTYEEYCWENGSDANKVFNS